VVVQPLEENPCLPSRIPTATVKPPERTRLTALSSCDYGSTEQPTALLPKPLQQYRRGRFLTKSLLRTACAAVVFLPWAVLTLFMLDVVGTRLSQQRRSWTASPQQLRALWFMSRPQNIPISVFRVVSGACSGQGLTWLASSAASLRLCLCICLAALLSSCSCMVNDYFEFSLATGDASATCAQQPLAAGEITPEFVRRALKRMYLLLLFGICLLETRVLRLYVLLSAALMYVYTKSLKPHSFLWKNGCVAALMALAVGLGAVAVEMPQPEAVATALAAALPSMAVVFFGSFGREVLADLADVDKDTAASAQTLPVVAGPVVALRAARACMMAVLALQVLVFVMNGKGLLNTSALLQIALGSGGLLVMSALAGLSPARARRAANLVPFHIAVVLWHILVT